MEITMATTPHAADTRQDLIDHVRAELDRSLFEERKRYALNHNGHPLSSLEMDHQQLNDYRRELARIRREWEKFKLSYYGDGLRAWEVVMVMDDILAGEDWEKIWAKIASEDVLGSEYRPFELDEDEDE